LSQNIGAKDGDIAIMVSRGPQRSVIKVGEESEAMVFIDDCRLNYDDTTLTNNQQIDR